MVAINSLFAKGTQFFVDVPVFFLNRLSAYQDALHKFCSKGSSDGDLMMFYVDILMVKLINAIQVDNE